jgi:L-malate glycosyltransferase
VSKHASLLNIAVCVILPDVSESIEYRAYAAEYRNVTLAARLSEYGALLGAPFDGPWFVCGTSGEATRVSRAGVADDAILESEARTAADIVADVMDKCGRESVLVVGLATTLLPRAAVHRLVEHHRRVRATASFFDDVPEAAGATLVDREFVEGLRALGPNDPLLSLRAYARALVKLAPEARPFLRCAAVGVANDCDVPVDALPMSVDVTNRAEAEVVAECTHANAQRVAHDSGLREFKARVRAARHASDQTECSGEPVQLRMKARGATQARGRCSVLLVSNASAFSGAEQSLCQLAGCMGRRAQVTAVVAYEGHLTGELRRRGVRVICEDRPFGGVEARDGMFMTSVLRAVRPDIVHLNAPIGPAGLTAMLAYGAPLCQHVRVSNVAMLREGIEAAARTIAISEFVRAKVLRCDVEPSKVATVYNGVDVHHFSAARIERAEWRRQRGYDDEDKVVLVIARVTREKRLELVVEALGRLAGDRRVRVCVVGEAYGQREYRASLERRLQAEGVRDRFDWAGFVGDVRRPLRAADVAVLCSEGEPFGRAVLEAMAMGVPVVVTAGDGKVEMVKSSDVGLVVPQGDAEALAEAIAESLADTSGASQRAERARAMVEREFADEVCCEGVWKVYQEMTGAVVCTA